MNLALANHSEVMLSVLTNYMSWIAVISPWHQFVGDVFLVDQCWSCGCVRRSITLSVRQQRDSLSRISTLSDWVKVLHPTRHNIGHFGDVLPSQSLGLVLKKLNLTQESKQYRKRMAKTHTRSNRESKQNLNLNQQLTVKPRLRDTTCCQTGCQSGCRPTTTGFWQRKGRVFI